MNESEERVLSDNAESSGWSQEKEAGTSSSSQSQGVPIGWPKVRQTSFIALELALRMYSCSGTPRSHM